MFLVQFSDNWADEMDVEGCMIMTREEYDAYLAAAREAFEIRGSVSFGVGTNESIEWETFQDFEKTLLTRYITEEEAAVLKTFGFDDFGFFPKYCFEDYLNEEYLDGANRDNN